MAKTMISTSTMKGNIIFVDTSALFAIANVRDEDHRKAREFLSKLAEERVTFLVTNFIISEIYTLMLRKIGRNKAIEYVEKLSNTAEIERVSKEDESQAWQIILRCQDKHFSYVDATSFAVMERLGINDAFSFDEHFRQYSFNRLPD
ncbi:MAG: PIN domain-containing protein [Euryarchaeota archaeon]|nr:PIN domain-containing protein [Euryarchaeota archaeon]